HAAVEELCGRLERRLRMTCPLCAAKFRRPEMEQHVWAAHQRVLDGINVVEPWRLIEKWLETYRLHGGADGLECSLAFGQRLGPVDGVRRVRRLVLSKGIEDAAARQALEAEAVQAQASLCPFCYAVVAAELVPLPPGLSVARGRIGSGGYSVEVSEIGWA